MCQLSDTGAVSSSHLSTCLLGPSPGCAPSGHISLQLWKWDKDLYKCLLTWKSNFLDLPGYRVMIATCVIYQVSLMTTAQGNS